MAATCEASNFKNVVCLSVRKERHTHPNVVAGAAALSGVGVHDVADELEAQPTAVGPADDVGAVAGVVRGVREAGALQTAGRCGQLHVLAD